MGAITGMLSTTAFFVVSITSTISDWSSATYKKVCALFNVILLGWPFTGMRAVTAGTRPRLTTSISRSRMLETYPVALVPVPLTAEIVNPQARLLAVQNVHPVQVPVGPSGHCGFALVRQAEVRCRVDQAGAVAHPQIRMPHQHPPVRAAYPGKIQRVVPPKSRDACAIDPRYILDIGETVVETEKLLGQRGIRVAVEFFGFY